MKIYNAWNDVNPNDNFYVKAENREQAFFAALEHLGWYIDKGENVTKEELFEMGDEVVNND